MPSNPHLRTGFIIYEDSPRPHILWLVAGYIVGACAAVAGTVIAVRGHFRYRYETVENVTDDPNGIYQIIIRTTYRIHDPSWATTGTGLIMLVLAIASLFWIYHVHTKHYREVVQGMVVNKRYAGRYHSTTVDFYITIRGYTRANRMRDYDMPVKDWYWQIVRIGDFVDFSE